MAKIDVHSSIIQIKIVYCGPGMSGKTTNLQQIHANAPPESVLGDLKSLNTGNDRTLFFDYLPLDVGRIGAWRTSLRLYTVPGQAMYAETRRMVLNGADGIIFVADSAPDRMQDNVDSMADIQDCIEACGLDPALPIILQYNKRDLADALTVERMDRDLNSAGYVRTEASALRGIGVDETLRAAAIATITQLKSKRSLSIDPRPKPSVAQMVEPAPASEQIVARSEETQRRLRAQAALPPSQPAVTAVPPAATPATPAGGALEPKAKEGTAKTVMVNVPTWALVTMVIVGIVLALSTIVATTAALMR